MKKRSKLFAYFIIIILAFAVVLALKTPTAKTENVALSQALDEIKAGKVQQVEVDGDKLILSLKDQKAPQQITFKESGANLTDYGVHYDQVNVVTKNPNSSSSKVFDILLTLLPIIIIIAFFYFIMRQAQGSSNQAMSFGKSRARLFLTDKQKVTFQNVAGLEDVKQELVEIVEFLKYPTKFENLGAKIPKGVLLFGAPGTGKTLLARAVAGEAGVPFFSISGSEFVEMFVGVGASRVRDLFLKAKKNAPCIVFIDEIDAVGRQRGTGMGGGHDEREQTLNQILVEMDGFEQGTNVIVMAATNRSDVLDPALLRPGRFDRRVILDLPDRKDRLAILEVHAKGKPLDPNVNLDEIAAKTPGFSGADIANLVNEAAILAARRNEKKIHQRDVHEAVEKVLLGPERKSHIMNEKEKSITAYHEAGHALVGHILPNTNPLHKISIVSRGQAAGVTWWLPTEDKHLHSMADFKDDLATALGGRIAEKIIFGEQNITTGAENDLREATHLARQMIMEYGMGAKLKNQVFGAGGGNIFLGRDLSEIREYSEDKAKEIDLEVAKLMTDAATKAEKTIISRKPMLDKIANQLLTEETIEGDALAKLLKNIDQYRKRNTKTTKTTHKKSK